MLFYYEKIIHIEAKISNNYEYSSSNPKYPFISPANTICN